MLEAEWHQRSDLYVYNQRDSLAGRTRDLWPHGPAKARRALARSCMRSARTHPGDGTWRAGNNPEVGMQACIRVSLWGIKDSLERVSKRRITSRWNGAAAPGTGCSQTNRLRGRTRAQKFQYGRNRDAAISAWRSAPRPPTEGLEQPKGQPWMHPIVISNKQVAVGWRAISSQSGAFANREING